ncbi:MAG: hypothetical protein LiPW15_783 [Parcubacteria group bacterium LiPW_15]|nr:MAG: hypothetical protein LiPW15_783 [Parcubacteria group bacterium LiPW_15]
MSLNTIKSGPQEGPERKGGALVEASIAGVAVAGPGGTAPPRTLLVPGDRPPPGGLRCLATAVDAAALAPSLGPVELGMPELVSLVGRTRFARLLLGPERPAVVPAMFDCYAHLCSPSPFQDSGNFWATPHHKRSEF